MPQPSLTEPCISPSSPQVLRRLTGRRVDPEGNAVYHLTDDLPTESSVRSRLVQREDDTEPRVLERLAVYRSASAGVRPALSSTRVAVDASRSKEEIGAEIGPTVSGSMPSRAPRASARLLLLGGPGAREEAVGAGLAARYGVAHVSARQLLLSAASKGNSNGKKLALYTAGELSDVPDELLGPLVLERLAADDVRRKGFVLTGFPNNATQAKLLKRKGVWIRQQVSPLRVHLPLSPGTLLSLPLLLGSPSPARLSLPIAFHRISSHLVASRRISTSHLFLSPLLSSPLFLSHLFLSSPGAA